MPPYAAAVPGYYNPEIEIFRGYWMISWFLKEFSAREVIRAGETGVAPEKLLDDMLQGIPPGCQGLMLQPYWGAGLKTPEARGSIIGFDDVHTRAHIYRAIIEGINYALIEGLERIESCSGKKAERIMVSGGGSQSSMVCRITADMFGRPVYRGHTHEASGLGAAIIGFVGLGLFKSFIEAVRNMVHYSDTFYPDDKNTRVYGELYKRVYKKIYPSLSGIYREIEDIAGS
jgi:sugar (pentulose or hexulose) kinase